MIASDHMTAALGEDPFDLVEQIAEAAALAGRLRTQANHMERVRKVKLAEAERAFRAAQGTERRVTVAEVEAGARTSPMYAEHLTAQREAEVSASEAEAEMYRLRNRQDWLTIAARSLTAEAYLSR